MKQFEIVSEPINPEKYREWTLNSRQGAIVVFTGHVREWTKGIKTEYLAYEAYKPMAEKKMAQIGEEIEKSGQVQLLQLPIELVSYKFLILQLLLVFLHLIGTMHMRQMNML